MDFDNITLEEFDAMWSHNENFSGKRADFSKLALYREIEEDLERFQQDCEDVTGTLEFAPNPRERNAMLCLDIKPAATFAKRGIEALTDIMRKADRVTMSGSESGIRISFGVEKIWTD